MSAASYASLTFAEKVLRHMTGRERERTPDLFLLIKSMTGAEKRYFTISSSQHVISGQNNYIKLFQAIDKQQTPDEEALLKKFEGEKFIRQLHRVKNYLYNLIIASLTRFYSEKNIRSQVNSMLDKAEVLYAKGLYYQCHGILLKAKKISANYELYSRLADILEFERRLMNHAAYYRKTEQDIQKIFQEKKECLSIQKNIVAYQSIARQLQFYTGKPFQAHDPSARLKIRSLFRELTETKKKNPPLSGDAEREYYLGCIFYYLLIHDTRSHYEYTYRYLRLIEKNEYYIRENPAIYITAISNFLMASLNTNKWDDPFREILSKLKNLYLNAPFKEYTTEDVRALLFVRYYINLLLFHEKSGNYDRTRELIPKIEAELMKHKDKISPRLVSILYFNLGCNCFGLADYHKANQYYNILLNQPEKGDEGIYCYSKVLSVLVHYELGHYELLEYMIKSARRMLSRNKEIFKMELFLLHFIEKKLLEPHSKKEETLLFASARKGLVSILAASEHSERSDYFDFISWAESKIQNISFAEAVKSKYS